MGIVSDLRGIQTALDALAATDIGSADDDLARLEDAAEEIGRSWSGSNLGYQAEVYYLNLERPPAGAYFSLEWGFNGVFNGTRGDWIEVDRGALKDAIYERAGEIDREGFTQVASDTAKQFRHLKERAVSILSIQLREAPDSYLEDVLGQLQELFIPSVEQCIRTQMRTHQVISRDMRALEMGWQSAPHQDVLAVVWAARMPYKTAAEAAALVSLAIDHLERRGGSGAEQAGQTQQLGTKVFIGHGRSLQWLVLKGFLQDKLGLTCDDFNREPVAGLTNVDRLKTMLDEAAIAFLVLTAEDEQSNGDFHARQNVVHEAGLFQGRLGFDRAIVMLEDGAVEWSNINGLGQIRFPRENLQSAFEDVRRVLEREGLIREVKA